MMNGAAVCPGCFKGVFPSERLGNVGSGLGNALLLRNGVDIGHALYALLSAFTYPERL